MEQGATTCRKTCTGCRENKSFSEFTLDKRTGKPKGQCRRCRAAREARRRDGRPVRPPRICFDCQKPIVDRSYQATLCTDCAEHRRRNRGSRDPLPQRRDLSPILPLVRQGYSMEAACRTVNVAWNTVDRRRSEDPSFAALLDEALAQGASLRIPPCGTDAKYSRGCRCGKCRASKRKQSKNWRDKIRSSREPDRIPHGISGRVNYLCKCEVCAAAQRDAVSKWQRSTNDKLLGRAHRHNSQWSGPEMELAARSDLSAQQVGDMIGRTLWAVSTMRRRLRKEPSQQWLAGDRSKLH